MIHPKTFHFLQELAQNNHRDWFNDNKANYDAIRKHNEQIFNKLIHEIAAFDADLNHLEAKDCVFRIYRDTRFSKDKTPYKTNMGAYMAKGGRKSVRAGYYIHLEPGASFLAGGVYVPEPPVLKAIRNEIVAMPDEFAKLVHDEQFVQYFGKLEGESLKKIPTGYPKDFAHPDWLKLKNLNMMHPMSDELMNSDKLIDYAAKVFMAMYPLNRFFNQIIDDVI